MPSALRQTDVALAKVAGKHDCLQIGCEALQHVRSVQTAFRQQKKIADSKPTQEILLE
jgi:hypothetical protein